MVVTLGDETSAATAVMEDHPGKTEDVVEVEVEVEEIVVGETTTESLRTVLLRTGRGVLLQKMRCLLASDRGLDLPDGMRGPLGSKVSPPTKPSKLVSRFRWLRDY